MQRFVFSLRVSAVIAGCIAASDQRFHRSIGVLLTTQCDVDGVFRKQRNWIIRPPTVRRPSHTTQAAADRQTDERTTTHRDVHRETLSTQAKLSRDDNYQCTWRRLKYRTSHEQRRVGSLFYDRFGTSRALPDRKDRRFSVIAAIQRRSHALNCTNRAHHRPWRLHNDDSVAQSNSQSLVCQRHHSLYLYHALLQRK